MGLQVPPQESAGLQSFLDAIGYEYEDESANPAYRMFLR
jgi:threonine dehydratase